MTCIRLCNGLMCKSPLCVALMKNLADIEAISLSVLDFSIYEAKKGGG